LRRGVMGEEYERQCQGRKTEAKCEFFHNKFVKFSSLLPLHFS
jgi:hypothetical protein